jgi:hypothetical protein
MQAIEEAISNIKYKYGNCMSTVNTNSDTYTIQALRLGKTPIEFSINKYQTLEDLYTLAEQEITLMNPQFRDASAHIEMAEIYEKCPPHQKTLNVAPVGDEHVRAIFFVIGKNPVTINRDPNTTFIDFLIENKKYIGSQFLRNKLKFYIVDYECFRNLVVQKMRVAYNY